jgi:hypothetical protein
VIWFAWLAGGVLLGGGVALAWPRAAHAVVRTLDQFGLVRVVNALALATTPTWLGAVLGLARV